MGDLVPLRPAVRASEAWIGKVQAAAHLGMSPSWVEKRQVTDGLPFRRVGGVNRYRRSELDSWVERMHAASLTDDTSDR